MKRTIFLNRIKSNIEKLKGMTNAEFCAVVKCNAYGHGAVEVAKCVENIVDCFAVSSSSEAEELVSARITKNILVLSGAYDGKRYPKNVIFSAVDERSFCLLAKERDGFAVKINTGMNRLGFRVEEFNSLIKNYKVENKIHSVFSHFSAIESVEEQFLRFSSVNFAGKKHISATNFTRLDKAKHLDMVRCGIGLYGYGVSGLLPALRIQSKILQVLSVSKGENIGYGSCLIDKDCSVAVIDIGYGDGFRRKINESDLFVFAHGKRCKVLGQVCMDVCMIEVPEGVYLKSGDMVEVLGDNITAKEIAEAWKTTEYEVLTQLSRVRGETEYIK